jgi:hypothetical protein
VTDLDGLSPNLAANWSGSIQVSHVCLQRQEATRFHRGQRQAQTAGPPKDRPNVGQVRSNQAEGGSDRGAEQLHCKGSQHFATVEVYSGR